MKLALSSAAAPDATLAELLATCARRGLAALELRAGDAHGVELHDMVGAAVAAARARNAGVSITGLRVGADADDATLTRIADALGAPLLLTGGADLTARAVRARQLADAGAPVLVVLHGASPRHDADIVAALGLALAWDAAPAERHVGEDARTLLEEHGARLRHITLLGGGPEAVMHEGRGVGELMGHLALAGFGGTLALAPGDARYHVAWQTWLGRRGGWGCGSRTADGTLVSLAGGA